MTTSALTELVYVGRGISNDISDIHEVTQSWALNIKSMSLVQTAESLKHIYNCSTTDNASVKGG